MKDNQGSTPSRENHLLQIAEAAKEIIFRYRITPSRGFEYISPGVTHTLGYTPAEFYSDPDLWLTTVQPEDRPLVEAYFSGQEMVEKPIVMR